MTLVRERRQQKALRLILPPPGLVHSSPLSSTSSSSSSPGFDALPKDLKKLSVLGRGNGGVVYKVCSTQTGEIYALKVLRCGEYNVEATTSEAEILSRLVDSSEYVVRCFGVLEGGFGELDGGVCFVMEYMDGGSLHDILYKKKKKKKLPEEIISSIARSVLRGLKYLHGMQIVHRDIKPSNLLVNTKGEVKIADFGASRVLECEGDLYDKYWCTGTCPYMSPERMDPDRWNGDECPGFTGDVWSLGVVAMECYAGRFPIVGPGQKPDWITLMCVINSSCLRESVRNMLRIASPEFRSFCQRCLERDWRKRGTVDELLLHPFLTMFEDDGDGEVLITTLLDSH